MQSRFQGDGDVDEAPEVRTECWEGILGMDIQDGDSEVHIEGNHDNHMAGRRCCFCSRQLIGDDCDPDHEPVNDDKDDDRD